MRLRGTQGIHWIIIGALSALLAVSVLSAGAQGNGGNIGGQGQQGGQNRGQGVLRNLVPRGIDWILANPADNSIIAHDPPVEDPNAPPKLVVKGQWLEIVRKGASNVLRQFHALDSPETTLTSGVLGEVKVKTPTRTLTYPLRVKMEGDLVTMTLYSTDEPQPGYRAVVYRIEKKDGVHLGDSLVVSGLIAPQNDGQRESYLQFTFAPVKKEPPIDEKGKEGGAPTKPGGNGGGGK